jgi:hypothetical protein
MWCPRCGSETEQSAGFCSTCGLDLATHKQMWQSTPPSASEQGSQTVQGAEPYQAPAAYPSPPTHQGPAYPQAGLQGQRPHIPSHLGLAIVGLILFWPTGIPAIVYATRVDSRLAWGDLAGAWEASHKANVWGWVSIGLTLGWILLWLLILAIGVGVAAGGPY